MPAVSRVDVDTATDPQGTAEIFGPGVPSVKVNGSTVSVLGDTIKPHGSMPPHPADEITTSSLTVFAGGLGVVRAGDITSFEDVPVGSIDGGSPNVNAN